MLAPSLVALALAAPGGVVPGFAAPEIAARQWFNHKATSLAKEAGRVVILEFWATW